MKFKSTLALSLLLHATLAAIIIIQPAKKGSGEMTYYVDLVSLGGGGPGGPGGGGASAPATGPGGSGDAALIEEKAAGVRDLTVEKEFKSPMRYPDKESRRTVEEEKMVTVVRKERAPVRAQAGAVPVAPGGGLKTGIRSGGPGAGAVPGGGGWGDGSGGPGGGYFPHAYYVDLLRNRISSSWYSALVAPGLKGKYVTGVYFIIGRDGRVSELRVERPSGIESLDLSARRAIDNAAPFPPLPNDFASQYLVVHFEFEWEK